MTTRARKHDVFICHAGEDKDNVARPLAEALRKRGWRVWFDAWELTVGDSLSRRIDSGLASTHFGVVILSPSFFVKQWPERELEGLTAREIGDGTKVILPVWHEVDHAMIMKYSPPLADRLGALTSAGVESVADEVGHALTAAGLRPGSRGRSAAATRAKAQSGDGALPWTAEDVRTCVHWYPPFTPLEIIMPGASDSEVVARARHAHTLSDGEELVAVWQYRTPLFYRLRDKKPDSFVFTTQGVRIVDGIRHLYIPYGEFPQYQFEEEYVDNSSAELPMRWCVIHIKGPQQWQTSTKNTSRELIACLLRIKDKVQIAA